MTISRRSFIGLGASLVASVSWPAIARARSLKPAELTGRILGVTTLNPDNHREEVSAVVSINLADDSVEYTSLPDHRLGHSLLPLPDGGFFAVPYGEDDTTCLFLATDLSVKGRFEAPAGHGFGGHAVVAPDGKTIVGHFNQSGYEPDKRTPDQTGQLYALDIESGELVKTLSTNILHGHDIILSRDQTAVIVGDDGTTEVRAAGEPRPSGDPFSLVPHSPSLSLFDSKTLALKKTIPLDINGSLVHIEQDQSGRVFGSVEQYVSRDEAGFSALLALLGQDGDVDRYVRSLAEEDYELELPYPGPLVQIDTETNAIERHLTPQNQAPFDIKINEKTGRVFNVFIASGMLARFDPLKQKWGFFSARDYGIDQPYGLTDIPGTTMMAVNGFMEGLAVFDTLTMALVKHIPVKNHGIKHLLYQA